MTLTPTAVRVVLIALTLFAAGRLLSDQHARATEIQPLDLAAMVLTPDDLEIHGLTGYGSDYGEYLTTRDYAAGFARQENIASEEALEIFEGMGLLRSYTVRLALPSEDGDFNSVATEGIHVAIFEYDSDASAGAMFDLAQEDIEDGDREVVESPKEFGDEWIFSRSDADDPESGDPARDLSLEFRTGSLTAVLTMFDIARENELSRPTEPDIDIVEQLGEQFLERIESADSSEQPLLGNQAVRLTDDDGSIVTVGDRYSAMDGAPIRRYAESDESVETRAERMATDGMDAIYGVEQDVRSGEDENPADPHLTVRLYQFEDDDAAAEWLDQSAYDRFAMEDYVQAIDSVELPFDLGYASIGAAYTAEYGGESLVGTAVWVHVNDIAARITLDSTDAIDLDVVEEIVEAQVDCLLGSPLQRNRGPERIGLTARTELERRASRIDRTATQIFLNAQELVVLGDAVDPGRRASLDQAGVGGHHQIGDERVAGLAGAVRDDRLESGPLCHLDCLERLGQGADLVELHQDRVAGPLGDAAR